MQCKCDFWQPQILPRSTVMSSIDLKKKVMALQPSFYIFPVIASRSAFKLKGFFLVLPLAFLQLKTTTRSRRDHALSDGHSYSLAIKSEWLLFDLRL